MNPPSRTTRALALATAGAAAGAALVAVAGVASAVGAPYAGTPIGTLTITPASGTNLSAIDYRTSAPCPAGTNFMTFLHGAGMPDAGEVITSKTDAGFSTTSPISSSFSNTPQFFADKNGATLAGRYDVVLRCTDRLGTPNRGEFHGVITFSSPTAYSASTPSTPTPTATATASATATATASPTASATATATASPTASATTAPPTGAPSTCTVPTRLAAAPSIITATRLSRVTITSTPGERVRLFAYTQPSLTYVQVREAVVPANGQVAFDVRPPRNTRLYAQQVGCDASDSVVVTVRQAMSITAERHGRRHYTFAGRVVPARAGQLVNVYRVDGGRAVLAMQARVGADGRWSASKRFLGNGRFGFVARTGTDMSNLGASSAVRSTLLF